MNDQQQSRADALTYDQRQALGEALAEYFGKLDSDEGIRTPEGRILRTFDYCDSRTIDDLIDRAIVPAFAASPVEQHEAAPADAQAHWKTETPPTKDGEHHEYIVAVRRAHDERRVFVFAASHANNYADDLHDQDGEEFIADGWYDIGEDPSGEFNTLFTPTPGPDDEVLGWQELPKWIGATSAQLEPTVTNRKPEAAPAEGVIEPTEHLINFSGHSLTLTGAQLLEALDFIAPDRDREQLETKLTFQRGEGHAGNGMYCWVTEYPEEGAIFVDGSTAIPAEVTLTAEEVAALHVLNEKLRHVDDMGPDDEGWQSDKLNAAWKAVDAVLARATSANETGAEGAKPIAWVRFRSDGGFEGPIMDSDERMCDVRRKSGAWTPLFGSPATAAEAVSIYQVAFDNAEEWLDADKKVFDTHPAHSRRIVYTAPQPPAQQVPSAGATLPDWAVTRAGSARDDADALKMAMRDYGMNDDNSAAFDFGAGFMRGIALGRALLATHREPVTARPTHPDNLTVDRLAVAMKVKLAEARAKGRSGWEQCSPADLSRMLREHVEKGDPRDVANFCAFLWDLRERIAAQPQPPIKCHGSPLSPTCPSTTCGIQRSSAELTDDDMRDAERYRAHIKYEYETLYMPRAEKKGLRPLAFAEYKASADQVADAARTQGSQS